MKNWFHSFLRVSGESSVKNCIYTLWLKVIIIIQQQQQPWNTRIPFKANKYILFRHHLCVCVCVCILLIEGGRCYFQTHRKVIRKNYYWKYNDLSKQQNIRFCNQKYVSLWVAVKENLGWVTSGDGKCFWHDLRFFFIDLVCVCMTMFNDCYSS